jgi:hypothetical protein
VLRLQARIPAAEPSGAVGEPAPSAPSKPAITIPHDILPVLAILRQHIADLTRDNAALRYVFLGGPAPRASSTIKLASSEADAMDTEGTANASKDSSGMEMDKPELERVYISGAQGVNLEQIVVRVKELVRENEELGELVMTLGQASPVVWQQALDGWSLSLRLSE